MSVLARLPGRAQYEPAHCPVDDWDFVPHFTDGVCPLCGWRPPGLPVEPPAFTRIDWFWPAVALLMVVSIAMGVIVLLAYNGS